MIEKAHKVVKILEDRFGWDCSTLEHVKVCPKCSRQYSLFDEFCSSDGTKLERTGSLNGVEQVAVALKEVFE